MGGEPRLADLTRLGAGREAEVFAWYAGRALRLARDPSRGARLRREALALECAGRAGVPVPRVHDEVVVEGRPGLVVDRVDGRDLLSVVERRPWRFHAVGRTCGALHARMHALEGPDELPLLADELRARLQTDPVPGDVRDAALRELERLPAGDRLCHGDFHPANVLAARDGPVVIDWTLAARGDPTADVARTRLLLLDSAVPEDASAILRSLAHVGRRLLFAAYLRGYRSVRAPDHELVRRWVWVCAAARLAEGIDAEHDALLATARSGAENKLRGWDSNPQPLG